MTRDQLEHVIRAAATIAGDTEIVVVGSQAILGRYPNAPAELLVSAPALNSTQLADTQTITYDVQHADDEAFTEGVASVYGNLFVQTGADGAGAAAAIVSSEMMSALTIPFAIVLATSVPTSAPTRLRTAAITTATIGRITRVDTTVAIELGASVQPFANSKR